MEYSNISSYIKGILKIGMLYVCLVPLVLFGQGGGEAVNLGEDGVNPLTDDITKKIPTLEVLIDSAIYNSHKLKYWDKEISISEYELKSTKREWSNFVYLNGEIKEGSWTSLVFIEDQLGNEVGTLGSTNQTRYTVGVSMRLPVYNVLDYGNRAKLAKMKIESNMEKRLDDQKTIRAEVINLYNELIIQQNMLKLDIDNIDFSTLTSEMAQREFQDGKISLADMSRVQDNLARARYRYVRTKIGFINAYVMLQEITGIKFAELNNWE